MACRANPYYYHSKEELERVVEIITHELDLTTRFACECLTKLEKENSPIPDYIKNWWDKHKELDIKREAVEQKVKEEKEAKEKKTQQLLNAVENGIETLFPEEAKEL